MNTLLKTLFCKIPFSFLIAFLLSGFLNQPLFAQNSYTVPAPSSSMVAVTPTAGKNYVKTITYREPLATQPTSAFKHITEIGYYDGLGRPVQNVSVGVTPSQKDLIQADLYDSMGREKYKVLPYATTDRTGAFRTGVSESSVSTYYSSTSTVPQGIETSGRAYSQTGFEKSPLNRVLTQKGPGDAWASKPIRINYFTNTDTTIEYWVIDTENSYNKDYYPKFSLYVTETTDEQGSKTREYKDKQGKVVQKSSLLGTTWLRTSYVYDDLGLLRCVVPPEADDPNTQTGLCYCYTYDSRNRMIEKKIPGGGTVKMVYDIRDRLRMTQNSLQDTSWSYIKYDTLNRPVITGVYKHTSVIDQAAMTALVNSLPLNEYRNTTAATYCYSNNSFPRTNAAIHSITYYDDYGFITSMNLGDSLSSATFDNIVNVSTLLDLTPKGRATGTMNRVLFSTSETYTAPDQFLFSAVYYDKYGKPIRTISENHLRGKDVVTNQYESITDLLLMSQQNSFKGSKNTKLKRTFEYDHVGRLLATRLQINTQAEITENAFVYNEVGQVYIKYLHASQVSGSRSFSQKIDNKYNIRGWLTKINDPACTGDNDFFGLQLCYESASALGTLGNGVTGYYNGNIVGMKWGTKNGTVVNKGYRFTYDDLNRLTSSTYADGTTLNSNTGYYNENITEYDKNGNIKRLERKYGNVLVDDLTYTYPTGPTASNQIISIADVGTASAAVEDYPGTSGTYSYDANGNVTHDGSRNTNLEYFPTMNIPKSVDFGNNNRIFYHYSNGGAKLIKHVKKSDGTQDYTHYIGNIIYENAKLSYIITEEGRLVNTGTTASPVFVYEYYLKDHLGNTRVSFLGSTTPQITGTSDYYPFGLTMSQTSASIAGFSNNKYLYNGKEIQNDNLNGTFFGWLDYGARFYDPQIGRFHTQDPMAMIYPSYTPYNYCLNNPIVFNDPNGMDVVNGFEKEREDKKAKKEKAQTDYNNTVKTGNEKQIKKAEKSLNKATRQFNRVDRAYQATENMINDLKANAPILYNLADNLTDANGTEVDIVVRAVQGTEFAEMEGNSQTDKMLGTGTQGEGIILGEAKNGGVKRTSSGSPYLPISSYDRKGFKGDGDNKVSVYLRMGQDAEWLAHEFGHALYLAPNLYQYYLWIISNKNSYQPGGHGSGDPNGKNANDVQQKYNNGGYR